MNLADYEREIENLENGQYPDYFDNQREAALFLGREIASCLWQGSAKQAAKELSGRCFALLQK